MSVYSRFYWKVWSKFRLKLYIYEKMMIFLRLKLTKCTFLKNGKIKSGYGLFTTDQNGGVSQNQHFCNPSLVSLFSNNSKRKTHYGQKIYSRCRESQWQNSSLFIRFCKKNERLFQIRANNKIRSSLIIPSSFLICQCQWIYLKHSQRRKLVFNT